MKTLLTYITIGTILSGCFGHSQPITKEEYIEDNILCAKYCDQRFEPSRIYFDMGADHKLDGYTTNFESGHNLGFKEGVIIVDTLSSNTKIMIGYMDKSEDNRCRIYDRRDAKELQWLFEEVEKSYLKQK